MQRHYRDNKEAYRKRVRTAKRKIRGAVLQAKQCPCADCGVRYPHYVMDFDHRQDKRFELGSSWRHRGLRAVLAEIKKCDVVCANCHRIRSFNRGQHR